jgi:hypothetical protein
MTDIHKVMIFMAAASWLIFVGALAACTPPLPVVVVKTVIVRPPPVVDNHYIFKPVPVFRQTCPDNPPPPRPPLTPKVTGAYIAALIFVADTCRANLINHNAEPQ